MTSVSQVSIPQEHQNFVSREERAELYKAAKIIQKHITRLGIKEDEVKAWEKEVPGAVAIDLKSVFYNSVASLSFKWEDLKPEKWEGGTAGITGLFLMVIAFFSSVAIAAGFTAKKVGDALDARQDLDTMDKVACTEKLGEVYEILRPLAQSRYDTEKQWAVAHGVKTIGFALIMTAVIASLYLYGGKISPQLGQGLIFGGAVCGSGLVVGGFGENGNIKKKEEEQKEKLKEAFKVLLNNSQVRIK